MERQLLFVDEMKTHIRALTVTPSPSKNNINSYRLRIHLSWLPTVGFVSDALVQMLPEPGGITFVLCDENIKKYSELYALTKEKDGNLILASHASDGYPQLCLQGKNVRNAGLTPGDSMLIRYKYGLIRLRKLPDGVKVIYFTPDSARFAASWLTDIGYIGGSVFMADAKSGIITCKLEHDAQNRMQQLVQHARRNKMYLLQVRKIKNSQSIDLTAPCLKRAGFTDQDVLLATYSNGLLQLQKPDFIGLGF
jgi:hypothetical protein